MRLYNRKLERLYLNRSERQRFKQQADKQEAETRLLCLVLYYTGCRISEALNIQWEHIQYDEGIIAIRNLKKRKTIHIRELPVPPELTDLLQEHQREHPNMI